MTSNAALTAFHPISASPQDTCPTQRAIAEHNSTYDTLKNGSVVAYKAACEATAKTPDKPASKKTQDATKDPKLS